MSRRGSVRRRVDRCAIKAANEPQEGAVRGQERVVEASAEGSLTGNGPMATLFAGGGRAEGDDLTVGPRSR